MPGVIIGGPFGAHTQKLMDAAKRKGYDLIDRDAAHGLPLLYPVGPARSPT